MTRKEVAKTMRYLSENKVYIGPLSQYSVDSILEGRSNYPVANLINYSLCMGFKIELEDWATLEKLEVNSILELHQHINLLMERWNIGILDIFRETGCWYKRPKTLDEKTYNRMLAEGKKYILPISIDTLLAVCQTLKCNLLFKLN